MSPTQRRSLISLVLLVLVVGGATEWWREHQAGNLGQQMAQRARPGDILMISSTTCPFCERARRWLTLHQVPFTECFIERDTACADRYQALGARGTPTLWVRGQAQLGFSPQQVNQRLAEASAGGG
jgi:glutaredoxin